MAHLGTLIALSDEMAAEGWQDRPEAERLLELRRRLALALGKLREIDGVEIPTTADGQMMLPIGDSGRC